MLRAKNGRIDRLVLERTIFNFVDVFSLFRNDLPLEKGGLLDLNKLHSSSAEDDVCQFWLNLAPSGFGKVGF